MFWAIIIVAAITLLLNACSYPLRLDPRRDDLQWKQKQCLDKGGSPQECQP
jgi:outer membrane biogenesis lipoprotein LolB